MQTNDLHRMKINFSIKKVAGEKKSKNVQPDEKI
jgi:hypothetical protein